MATEDMTMPKARDQPTEPSVESASRSQRKAERPKISPYTSPIAKLFVGSEQKAYYIPRDLLHNSNFAASLDSEEIYLPDLDENTGHVLIHYLYTGTYQTLDSMAISASEELQTEFKRSVLAYATAISHEVHGLEQLAKEEIEHLGAGMNIIDIVEAIQEEYSKIPSDAGWFHDYFDQTAKATFEMFGRADAELLWKQLANDNVIEDKRTSWAIQSLFDRIENIPLMRALIKSLWREYQSVLICDVGIVGSNISAREENFKSRTSPIKETSEKEHVVAEELPVENTLEKEPINEAAAQEAVVEEPIAVAEPEAEPEELRGDTSDPWGPATSNLTSKKPKKSKKSKKVPEAENSSPPHVDPQSVDVLSPIAVKENPDFSWDYWGVPASKKKKSKKAPIPDASPSPTPENLAPAPSSRLDSIHENKQQEAWRGYVLTTSNKDGDEAQNIPPTSASHVELEPENKESGDWGTNSIWGSSKKKKKGKKSKIDEPASEAVLEPIIDDAVPVQELRSTETHYEKGENQPITEHRNAPEATESVHKSPAAEAIGEMVPAPVEKPQEDDPWGMLSLSTGKKKKKIKKGLRSANAATSVSETIEPSDPVSEVLAPATDAIPAEGGHVMPMDPVGLDNDNTNPYPELGSEQHSKVQGEPCPLFNEHSQQGDQWRSCQRCQAYMHQVAVNQVRRSHPSGAKSSWLPDLVR